MENLARPIAIGGAIGLLAAGMLALPTMLPPTLAHEEPARTLLSTSNELFPRPLSADMFVKPPRFITEPYVATEVIREATVRKIGFGKTEFVRIATTATGTYSSDALDSPHVLYPGFHVNPDYVEWERSGVIASLDGQRWVMIRPAPSNSFVQVFPFKGGRLGIREDGSVCAKVGRSMYC